MKKISALFFSAAVFFAAGAQAQVTKLGNDALSASIELVQKEGDARSTAKFQADCAAGLALDSCAKPVTPKGCPAGQHWTTMGSGIAHCVNDDPVCNGTVTHDTLGNPTGCTPAKPTVVSSYYNYMYFNCPAGQTGTDYERYKVTIWSDGTSTYGDWEVITYTCGASTPPPPPPPTCSNGGSDYPTCTPPWTPPPVCSNGASNYPTCTFPATETPPPTCTASDIVVSSTPCGAGMAGGPIDQHQTVTCPGSVVGGYTAGTCTPAVCANGATNYPTCTLEPVKPTCPESYNWCYLEAGQSGDPREDWYYFGTVTYEGPTCTPQTNPYGQRAGTDGGCPAGF